MLNIVEVSVASVIPENDSDVNGTNELPNLTVF